MKKTALSLALATVLVAGAPVAMAATASTIASVAARADGGDVEAMYEAGRYYLATGEVPRGILYLESVIRSGAPNGAYAHAALADYYEGSRHQQIAREAMYYHLQQAAVKGDVASQVKLGKELMAQARAPGTDPATRSQSQNQARVLLEHAFNAGDETEAGYLLGHALLTGDGQPTDPMGGQAWLAKAAQRGHTRAAAELANHYVATGNGASAKPYYELAANAGDGNAMLALANGHLDGSLGALSPAEAKHWADRAVAAGVAGATTVRQVAQSAAYAATSPAVVVRPPAAAPVPAMEERGFAARLRGIFGRKERKYAAVNNRYEPENGVVAASPEDEAEVLRRKVAQLEAIVTDLAGGGERARVARAQSVDLSLEYQDLRDPLTTNQRGLDAHAAGNYAEAYRYFSRAARSGDVDAMNNMGLLLLQGLGVEQNAAKAMEMFRKASEMGHATAAHNIGYMYENGVGVRQDISRSRVWYRHSATMARRAGQVMTAQAF